MSSLLYDRIINISLQTEEMAKADRKTITIYKDTGVEIIPEKTPPEPPTLLRIDRQPNRWTSNKDDGSSTIYARLYNPGKDKKLLSGTTCVMKSMDQMMRGRRNEDNSPLQIGDLVYVTMYNDGKVDWSVGSITPEWQQTAKWKVYIIVSPPAPPTEEPKKVSMSRSPLAPVVEETFALPVNSVKLKCASTGMKPDISIDVNRIPGELCYKMIVRVRNLGISDIDIRRWSRISVVAGYLDGPKQRFDCPIFSSYIESPSPDGITAFECLTVGTTESIIDTSLTRIVLDTRYSVRRLINIVGAQISSSQLDIINQLPDSINDIEITSDTETSLDFTNIYAVVTWLQTTLNDAAQSIVLNKVVDDNIHPKILVQIYRRHLNIFTTNMDNKIPAAVLRTATYLQAVTGVTFNGTACTVEAPWIPTLEPGGLFYLTPDYRRGSLLPNIFDESLFSPKDNLYRVITMRITFSTCGSENKMTIFAMPESMGIRSLTEEADQATQEEIERATPEDTAINRQANVTGDPSDIKTVKRSTDIEQATNDMFKIPVLSLGSATDLVVVGDQSNPQYTGSSYSTIADIMYRDIGLKPLYLDEDDPTKESKTITTRVIYPAALWPIICVATKQMHDAMAAGNKYYNVNMKNFEILADGATLRVPLPTSFKEVAPVKDIFLYVYNIYRQLQAERGTGVPWLPQWRDLLIYLGGPVIED